MKKMVLFFLLVFSLIIAGCSQSGNQASSSQTSSKPSPEAKSDFPKKPIQLIVSFTAGGGPDTVARILAEGVKKHLPNGQSVVVVNKPGGAATIGLTEVFTAKPDGYTIGITPTAPISIQPHFGKTPYSHDSFQPIMRVISEPSVLYVKSDAPWKTYEDWVEYVKQNPGEFTYSTSGVGSNPHITMESINSALGIQTTAVPYDGGAQMMTALLGDHVQGTLVLPTTAKPHIESGAIRPLFNAGKTKIEEYTDTPMLKDDKGVDVASDITTGLVAPKGIPQDVLTILHDAFKKALEDPEVVEQIRKTGVEPSYGGPEEYQQDITESYNFNGEILKNIGLVK